MASEISGSNNGVPRFPRLVGGEIGLFKKYKIVDAGGNGDCMPRAILKAAGKDPKNFQDLRNRACEVAKKEIAKLKKIKKGKAEVNLMDLSVICLACRPKKNVRVTKKNLDKTIKYYKKRIPKIKNQGKWSSSDDLPFYAKVLNRPIILYALNPKVQSTPFEHTTCNKDGVIDIPEKELGKRIVRIYYKDEHFQALLPRKHKKRKFLPRKHKKRI